MDRKLRIPEEPESSHPDSIRVLMKLSNGKRLERRFLKSHPLQVRGFLVHSFLLPKYICLPQSCDLGQVVLGKALKLEIMTSIQNSCYFHSILENGKMNIAQG